MHPPSFVTRHRTVFALGSVALAAALGVMLVYVNRVPTGAIGANGNQFTRSSDNAGTTACATRTAASHRPRAGGIRPG